MRNIVRWTPRSSEMSSTLRSFDDLFNELWAGWPMRYNTDTTRPMTRPAMDVIENDNELTIRVDLPGMSSDDVAVEVEGDVLTVSGEREQTIEQENEQFHYRERSHGAFKRSLRLPDFVDTAKVDATFKDGVLDITLPKLPETQPRRIKVESA
ncbi:MAG: Hsp20/alpha crystallin family protein [Anaerolineae bacterium]|nr:Hsp20/alpha crystallin family protein [Anaerolineae bacterium]